MLFGWPAFSIIYSILESCFLWSDKKQRRFTGPTTRCFAITAMKLVKQGANDFKQRAVRNTADV